MSTAAVASIPIYSDGHDVAQDNLYKEEIKDSEKRLGSALGIPDEPLGIQLTNDVATAPVGRPNSKVNRAMALGATAKKPPTSGRRNTPMGAAGKGGMSTSATTRNMNKKGVSQQGTHSQSVSSTYAAPLTDTIAELGAEEDLAAEGQSNRDPQGKILNPPEDPFKLIEDEEMSGDSDLDIDDIINQKESQNPYAHACKSLGVVPVSYILDRINQQEIIMPHHGIGIRGAQALAHVLKLNTTLVRLDLTNNSIKNGGVYIGSSLKANRTLTHLNLSDNQMGPESGKAIATMIADNTSLTTVLLRGNNLGDKEASYISDALKQNSTLEVLDLSYNQIGNLGGLALGVALVANETLRDLNVSWNEMRSRGIGALLTGAKDNISLIYLNIRNNGIGENGAAVNQFLARNTTVTTLDIGFTRCDDPSMIAIAKAIEANHSLVTFNISGNPISDDVAQVILKAVTTSKIKRLIMQNVRVSSKTQTRINELNKERNGSFQILT
ncbi:hypothetical protein BASA50_001654 [Batrachochytrium salamandrivorans]|uniref:Uncharacterized protein n=1 Tax=Batrachochytrium salamandrivorans TaxID=1357716 RepID=A0ABQ8FNJ6_9FUNG|nr:hypothetical protein BASA50_001654 [Batrachochytrium salamandrivorans]